MPKYVRNGAMISCNWSLPVPLVPPLEPPKEPPGPNPCVVPLTVLPIHSVLLEGQPMATKMDHMPFVNIPTFGMCVAPLNPGVKAALGFPIPCVPTVITPWSSPKDNVKVGSFEALLHTSTCKCTLGDGTITVSMAGQTSTTCG